MLKRLLLLSVCLYSVAAFATATDGRIQCEENLSDLDCMEKACTEMTNIQNVNSKADYDKVKSKWYDKIKDECPIADLQKLYDKATKSESVYKISIPKSSVATTRHYINLKLNPDKIRPEYKGKFMYVFMNNEKNPLAGTKEESLLGGISETVQDMASIPFIGAFTSSTNSIARAFVSTFLTDIPTACSDFSFVSNTPVDEASVNKNLQNANLPIYKDYTNPEYFIFNNVLWVNYGSKWNTLAGGTYSNKIVLYDSYDIATKTLDEMITNLSQGACCDRYIHVVLKNNPGTTVAVKKIPCNEQGN